MIKMKKTLYEVDFRGAFGALLIDSDNAKLEGYGLFMTICQIENKE